MLVGGGMLIDLRRGRYRLNYRDICGLLNELKPALWPVHNRIALVSAPAIEQSDQLFMLSLCLSERGCKQTSSTTSIGRSSGWPRRKNLPSNIDLLTRLLIAGR